MKILKSGLFFVMLLLLVSCDDAQKIKPEQQLITKAQFLGRMVVPERYWRIEEISRQQEEQVAMVNVRESSPILSSHYLNDVVPFVAMQFTRGLYGKGTVSEGSMTGAYGKIPFGEFKFMLLPRSLTESGEWEWDSDRKMIRFTLPESIRSIAGALSRSDWRPETGYVADVPAPLYRGVEEARRAATPERIRILVEQPSEKDTITYVFTMRAAWLTDVEFRDEEHKYGVSLY
ncbi:hypothetical protein GCM10010967_28480 [Dyadobacter beijingensis]|uniref:Lipoprotein n=1 Tax=Dyadobacter beijingensis TaxID=365489 RepID=A0ABQ2HWD2_9BACT|nr:hypothetical protein [Dyadobacter beijingensis]GGM93605.1 hypothetical protein GCM10010967_28480 [Dyadobacter beijingensis]